MFNTRWGSGLLNVELKGTRVTYDVRKKRRKTGEKTARRRGPSRGTDLKEKEEAKTGER